VDDFKKSSDSVMEFDLASVKWSRYEERRPGRDEGHRADKPIRISWRSSRAKETSIVLSCCREADGL
jgi:hypothetical protein